MPTARAGGRVSRSTRLLAQAAETNDLTLRRRLLDEAVLRHRSVARLMAARHRRRDIPDEDLERVAHHALVRAVHEFDPDLEPDFLAYAVRIIRGDLRTHLGEHGWAAPAPTPEGAVIEGAKPSGTLLARPQEDLMIRVEIELPDPPPELSVDQHVAHCLRGLDLAVVRVTRVEPPPEPQDPGPDPSPDHP